MAKYVLLAFDDDAYADAFVEFGVGDHDIAATVRGVWRKPTKFCECVGVRAKSFTRGKKYGWWVCATCMKPTVAWAHGDAWYTALGTNLLPIQEGIDEYRGPGHKQHPTI